MTLQSLSLSLHMSHVEIYICSSVLQSYLLGSEGHVPSVHNPHLLFLQSTTMTSAKVLIDIAELISVSSYVSCGDLHLFFSSFCDTLQLLGVTRSCAICAQPTLIFFFFFTTHSEICLSLSLPHRHLALHP